MTNMNSFNREHEIRKETETSDFFKNKYTRYYIRSFILNVKIQQTKSLIKFNESK